MSGIAPTLHTPAVTSNRTIGARRAARHAWDARLLVALAVLQLVVGIYIGILISH